MTMRADQPLIQHVPDDFAAEASVDVAIIGAGAAGLIAALRAKETGASVLVLERDAVPRGSTALSAGLIPAAGTRFQRDAGISDSKAAFAADIMKKAHDEPDPAAVAHVVNLVVPALEWLADHHGLPFSVINDFSYPGHSACRMHGLASRSGAELMDRLRSAAEAAGVDIVTEAQVTTLLHDEINNVRGIRLVRPDGSADMVGCNALLLACNGYGGNSALVAAHIPEMARALYFGHPGNQGDAVLWGKALGAATRHLPGYQGHGSVAHPHGILITWATITEGGFQVNVEGQRFANEARGYSEAATAVLAQPEGIAWTIFDGRIAAIARQFEDFRHAETAGAILSAATFDELAALAKLPPGVLARTAVEVDRLKASAVTDSFGRQWSASKPLAAPFHAVRVTGALFHTQGGLVVGGDGRVLTAAGTPLPNLFAAGGAACGVSGASAAGYLSGNGLLTAVAYGYTAGAAAAGLARRTRSPLPSRP
jgi:fumarate reductase flavoprotein subunit